MKQIIEQIHNSNSYGVIVEIGAGLPISNLLYSVAGASKTIYSVESPYSRESFEDKYGSEYDGRAVASERLESIREYYDSKLNRNQINFVIATTFQVGHKNENNFSTHGWIMLATKEDTKYYHVSLHEPLTREDYIKNIGEVGALLLNGGYFENSYIDIVLNKDFSYDLKSTLEFITRNSEIDQMSVFTKDSKIDRLESVTRSDDEIVLFKGSFNPISKAHEEVMIECKKLYPQSNQIFEISVNTFGKGKVDIDSLINRIELINELGYDVILNSQPLFKNTFDFLRNKFKGKIIFPMGLDTLNRLIMDYIKDGEIHANEMICDFYNAQLICLNRNGNEKNNLLLKTDVEIVKYVEDFYHEISSTDIRSYIANGDFDEIKKIVPTALHEMIKNKWMNNGDN